MGSMWLSVLVACTGEVIHHPDTAGESPVAGFSISGVDPSSGPESGGTFVRIAGSGFSTATAVKVGGQPCASTTLLSSTEIFCTTPPGAVGEVALTAVNGTEEASATFTYLPAEPDTGDTGEASPVITDCLLEEPLALSDEEYQYTEGVLGRVTVPGRTGFDSVPLGVEAEAGWGPAADDPDLWTWSEMAFLAAAGEASEYSGGLALEGRGTYAFAVRFRVDHGPWSLCRSAAGSFGAVEVVPDTVEEPVDYCHMQWPCDMTAPAGETSPEVYAWIYEGGVSQGAGQGVGVLFDVGVGNAGSDPESDASWRWFPMDYFADKDGLSAGDLANDEYVGTFAVPGTPGTYAYTARASADDGLTWTLCDLGGDSCNLGGSSDGYDDPGVCIAE